MVKQRSYYRVEENCRMPSTVSRIQVRKLRFQAPFNLKAATEAERYEPDRGYTGRQMRREVLRRAAKQGGGGNQGKGKRKRRIYAYVLDQSDQVGDFLYAAAREKKE